MSEVFDKLLRGVFTMNMHEKVALVSRINNINRQKMGVRSGRSHLIIKTMLKKWENFNINGHKCVIMSIIKTIF